MPTAQIEARVRGWPLQNSVVAAACMIVAVALPAAVIYYLAVTPAHTLLAQVGVAIPPANSAEVHLFSWQRIAVVACGAVPAGCVAYGLLCARRCFRAFSRGEYFTLHVVRGLRGFAAGIFFSGVCGLLVTPLLSALLTLAEEKSAIAFSVGSTQLLTLVFGSVVWQIAAVMTRAVAIAEENSQFV